MKSVRAGRIFGPYLPPFGLNTERYGVCVRIQSECEKMRTRKTPNTETFEAVEIWNYGEGMQMIMEEIMEEIDEKPISFNGVQKILQ